MIENLTENIIAFEDGELSETKSIELFSHLIETGLAWSLQGFYGRTARDLIDAGYLDNSGKILDGPCSG